MTHYPLRATKKLDKYLTNQLKLSYQQAKNIFLKKGGGELNAKKEKSSQEKKESCEKRKSC